MVGGIAITLWLDALLGTLVAVQRKRPYGFGGHGRPDNVWGDFVNGGGTALSPPLPIMIVFLAMIVLATRRGWLGLVGVVGLTLLALLFLPAIIGEPLARRFLMPSTASFPETALVAISLVGAVLMFLFGVWTLVQRYQGRRA